jgi:hypothetical protein
MFPGHNLPEIELGWLREGESVGEKGSAEGGVDSEEQEENIVCGSGDSIDEVVVVGEFGMTIAF